MTVEDEDIKRTTKQDGRWRARDGGELKYQGLAGISNCSGWACSWYVSLKLLEGIAVSRGMLRGVNGGKSCCIQSKRPEPTRLSLTLRTLKCLTVHHGLDVMDALRGPHVGGPIRWDGGQPQEHHASITSDQRTESSYSRQHILSVGSVIRLAQLQISSILSCRATCVGSLGLSAFCSHRPDVTRPELVSASPRRVRDGRQLGIVSFHQD